ncbi:MAG: cadherin-like beta sandwich domain-containing protein, partial [Comamonadaceae bacterium]
STGSTNIPGIVYEVYFANTGNTQTGRITNIDVGNGTGSMLLYFDTTAMDFAPVGALIIKSQSNRLFGMASFQIHDYQEWESTYTATAYRNNVQVGMPSTFTTGGSFDPVTIPLGAQFANVDEIRVTSNGGTSGAGAKLWYEGFNTFVFVNPTGNADLSALSASAGALVPSFAAGTTSYTIAVPNATASTTITPTVDIPGVTVTVNGVSVASGSASGPIALNVGGNTITIVVTALNGTTTKTYTVTVTRAASSNNNLAALSLSSGTLSPVFAAGTTSYTASVPFTTTSLTVTPTTAVGTASVTVNGVATASGNASGAIALAVGANTITTVVTAQNGTTRTYTVTVNRAAASSNNFLSALSLSSGTLAPAFAAGTTSYTASVGNATTSLTVTPTVADATASVTVNGVATASGNASGAIALNVGSNTITTVVTAQDGSTTKTYTVTVTRAASSNNNLSALSLSSGTLSPAFDPATITYAASLATGVSSITVTPTVTDPTASITVNGVAVTSGAASGAMAMSLGSNTVTVVVTAQNGAAKTYSVTVTRALPSANADLSALSLSAGTLAPAFAAGTISYTASVGNAATSLTVMPTVADATASITVNGVATASGNASGAIALAVGTNTITTTVTAQDGTTVRTYTVTVVRAGSGDASLSALVLSGGSISPAFTPSTTSYTLSIAAATASITATPTVNESNAIVTVNGVAVASGTASGAIPMNIGSNTVTVMVTAQDGTTMTYTVTVTRALSTNNDLAALTLSSGTLNPVFSAAQQSYTAAVPNAVASITITPTLADSSASVTVNGIAVASGSPSASIALNVGSNVITVVATAQNGSPRSYTITVTRGVSANADLSGLAISSGTLTPAFASGITAYQVTVPDSVTFVTLTPTSAGGTITVNGVATLSGSASAPIALVGRDTAVTVQVTAPDGVTTKNYTVNVVRARPTTATGMTPTGGGNATASLSGPSGCGFDRAEFIPVTGGAGSPPAGGTNGFVFPQGLFDVIVAGCPPGAMVTITITYPQTFPPGAVYLKYGPTQTQSVPHWYMFAGAAIIGNTVTLQLIDGGMGDDDLVINGIIPDPGGVALAAGGPTGIPALSRWGGLALSLLLTAAVGLSARRTTPRTVQRPVDRA